MAAKATTKTTTTKTPAPPVKAPRARKPKLVNMTPNAEEIAMTTIPPAIPVLPTGDLMLPDEIAALRQENMHLVQINSDLEEANTDLHYTALEAHQLLEFKDRKIAMLETKAADAEARAARLQSSLYDKEREHGKLSSQLAILGDNSRAISALEEALRIAYDKADSDAEHISRLQCRIIGFRRQSAWQRILAIFFPDRLDGFDEGFVYQRITAGDVRKPEADALIGVRHDAEGDLGELAHKRLATGKAA